MMNGRVRVNPARTQRVSKYLKPGALAQLRDSRISIARSQVLTRRVNSVTRFTSIQEVFLSAHNEFLPEFPSLEHGPRCFGRKKLAAAKNGLNHSNLEANGSLISINSHINLAVH